MNLSALPTVYSVFDYRTGLYNYFAPPEQPSLPASGAMRPARGTTPESLALVLPEGCKQTGSGERARGVIATAAGFPGALGDTPATPGVPLLAVGAALGALYLLLRKPQKGGRR